MSRLPVRRNAGGAGSVAKLLGRWERGALAFTRAANFAFGSPQRATPSRARQLAPSRLVALSRLIAPRATSAFVRTARNLRFQIFQVFPQARLAARKIPGVEHEDQPDESVSAEEV
jgi:hypothetical protein